MPASRTVVAKAIITTLLLINILLSWTMFGGGQGWSLPNAYGLALVAIFALALGWLHVHRGMTGAKPAVTVAWIVGFLVAVGGYTAWMLSRSDSRDADAGLAVMYAIASTQLLVPIAARWAQKADETFWTASKKVLVVVVFGIAIGVVLRYR